MKFFLKRSITAIKTIDYHSFLMGALFIAMSVFFILNFEESVQYFSILLGILMVIKGFYNFILYSINCGHGLKLTFKWPRLFVLSGILGIILGLTLIFNFEMNSPIIYGLLGFWIFIDTIPHIFLTEHLSQKKIPSLLMNRITYGAALICAMGLVVQSILGFGIDPTLYLIIYTIISGAVFLLDSYPFTTY